MTKYLFLTLVLYGIYFFFFRKKKLKNNLSKDTQIMLECKKCGVFVSADEAFIKNGEYFCSKPCLKGE